MNKAAESTKIAESSGSSNPFASASSSAGFKPIINEFRPHAAKVEPKDDFPDLSEAAGGFAK